MTGCDARSCHEHAARVQIAMCLPRLIGRLPVDLDLAVVEGPVARVLIVDNHPVVRMGLRAMLEQATGFEICGEAGST